MKQNQQYLIIGVIAVIGILYFTGALDKLGIYSIISTTPGTTYTFSDSVTAPPPAQNQKQTCYFKVTDEFGTEVIKEEVPIVNELCSLTKEISLPLGNYNAQLKVVNQDITVCPEGLTEFTAITKSVMTDECRYSVFFDAVPDAYGYMGAYCNQYAGAQLWAEGYTSSGTPYVMYCKLPLSQYYSDEVVVGFSEPTTLNVEYTPVGNCVDTDGGANPLVVGVAYYVDANGVQNSANEVESCTGTESVRELIEPYCDANGNIKNKVYTCSGGCMGNICEGTVAQIPNPEIISIDGTLYEEVFYYGTNNNYKPFPIAEDSFAVVVNADMDSGLTLSGCKKLTGPVGDEWASMVDANIILDSSSVNLGENTINVGPIENGIYTECDINFATNLAASASQRIPDFEINVLTTQSLLADGEACTLDSECTGGYCGSGLCSSSAPVVSGGGGGGGYSPAISGGGSSQCTPKWETKDCKWIDVHNCNTTISKPIKEPECKKDYTILYIIAGLLILGYIFKDKLK